MTTSKGNNGNEGNTTGSTTTSSVDAADVPAIKTDDLAADVTYDAATHRFNVALVGSAESGAMAALDGMLKALHREAMKRSAREVVIDLRELEFMNSSCFKAFVSWLGELQETDDAKQYRIKFVSDEKKHWQRRSLGALSCFAVDLITIET